MASIELQGGRGDLLMTIRRIAQAALLDPNLTAADAKNIGEAVSALMTGWREFNIAISGSNSGYEEVDLSTEMISLVKQVDHLIGILLTVGGRA